MSAVGRTEDVSLAEHELIVKPSVQEAGGGGLLPYQAGVNQSAYLLQQDSIVDFLSIFATKTVIQAHCRLLRFQDYMLTALG